MMITPLLKDEAFLADIDLAKGDLSCFHLWWLGQSGFLIQWQGQHLLIDPYLSDSLTLKYAKTDKQHIRMTELIVNPGSLDFIDVLTSSHNHTDHLDGDTLIPIIEENPKVDIVVSAANQDFAAQRINKDPERLIGLNDNTSVHLSSGFTVHGIPAAHNELDRDEQGNCRYLGYVFQFGNYTVYHSGDTLWRSEIISALEKFDIDIAILPINGNKPERRVAGNLNAQESVAMAKSIGAKIVIPCHYHMFTFNTVDPDDFIRIAQKEGQQFRVLSCGERFRFSK